MLLAKSGGSSPDKLYVDSVFQTYLYTGNGSTQTITNGIDLAGEGGLVWLKSRSAATDHQLFDTARGATYELISNSTAAQATDADTLTSFGATGFSLGADSNTNTSGSTYASWTFRKAPKFFDVVTYTGNGVAGRTIAHSLGVAPGMIIVKCTNVAQDWIVWHSAVTNPDINHLKLNTTDAAAPLDYITNVNSISFSVAGVGPVNGSGWTYVAYLFAHDTDPEGIIQCGSFTTDASGSATVNLGWEPQFIICKDANYAIGIGGDWNILDAMRGSLPAYSTNFVGTMALEANTASAEASVGGPYCNITATGFYGGGTASHTYIYMAIRRPNKPPTSGTEVYNAIARTGTGGTISITGAGFSPDLVASNSRNSYGARAWFDRLRGGSRILLSSATTDEGANTSITSFDMDGFTGTSSVSYTNDAGQTYVYGFFRRAPGFFDVVAYTGMGVARTVNHNLGVTPELMIVKGRSYAGGWVVYHSGLGATKYLPLNGSNPTATLSTIWNDTEPTASVFTVGTGANSNNSGSTFVAYLFASLPGISKVGSYTGNGASQTIDCGFSTGARFILIKRTDSTGDWFVWDTARGIVAATDPHLSLNTTAAEVTTDDSVDPASSGFIVNQVAATNINVNNATYTYLAIA